MTENAEVQWALDLLEPYREDHWFYSQQPHVWFFGVGVAFACYSNYLRRRPIMSGIQQHLFWGAAYSAVVGGFFKKYSMYKREKEAAITRDYIIKHPEDFPEPKRLTWGEVFDPWIPIR